MSNTTAWQAQQDRNDALLQGTRYMRNEVTSEVLPFQIDIGSTDSLVPEQETALQALEIEAARTAIRSLASLAKINELDHLGGSLDLIPALTLTLSLLDYEKKAFTIENAHTSIGYYSALAAYGFLDSNLVIDTFRRGLDIAGHVSWVPGGTQLQGGRLGVMVPAAVGQALGKRAIYGAGAWVLCHCGDAGWISGQALNGFNAADLHRAPISFVMHRNGIQLSGSNRQIMDKDPRPIIAAMGIELLEIPSLHETGALYRAYREAYDLAQSGRPAMVYPTGLRSTDDTVVDLRHFGERYGIGKETAAFAATHGVPMDTRIWVPGALMGYRDVGPMLECLFLVNDLPGGAGHHDGHMKGRDEQQVLANPMLTPSAAHTTALKQLADAAPRSVVTRARPAPGAANLTLTPEELAEVELPAAGKMVSPRAGSETAYAAVAKAHPDKVFNVSCDLDPSTKLGKARKLIGADQHFEMSIEEQASAIMANGLAVSSDRPQLNVFSTFAAFFEGIAREGMEMWRYQRNLNGLNEGLNVVMHLSHVGACTGRDHFSGWALDWINLALGYLPYLHRFYAPADARAAFVAVKDQAAHCGGHIIGIPRDNLPILGKQDGSGPLWDAADEWEPVTAYRVHDGARRAILAFGAPAFLAGEASESLQAAGVAADVHIVNGLPLPEGTLEALLRKYPEGLVTVEDGIVGNRDMGIQGFAGVVASAAVAAGVQVVPVGIVDARVAPSEGHMEVWEHFGLTAAAIAEAVQAL